MNTSSPSALLTFLATQCRTHPPIIAALATLSPDSTPRVRHIVLRGLTPRTATLWLSSHTQANKVHDLRTTPTAELALWFSEERLQLRLLARWQIIDSATSSPTLKKHRLRAWHSHSPTSRTMFSWPPPGLPLKTPQPPTPSNSPSPPDTFTLLLGTLTQLDALHLTPNTHTRHLHHRTPRGWRSTPITP